MANGESEDLKAFNYCVSFIDLLGQQNAAKGQGLLPRISSEAEDKAFQEILLDNIGGILELQRDVEEMESVLSPDPNSKEGLHGMKSNVNLSIPSSGLTGSSSMHA